MLLSVGFRRIADMHSRHPASRVLGELFTDKSVAASFLETNIWAEISIANDTL